MTLQDALLADRATLAPDGIPLQFGDLAAEYRAALDSSVLMVRSHEGRLELTGRDRLAIMHRISTNDLEGLTPGEGRPTIFTNANARIVDRATVYHRGERALALSEPGRAQALAAYLQRNIFFNDDARIANITARTHQFDLHGPRADVVMDAVVPGAASLAAFHSQDAEIGDVAVFIARNKPLEGTHWTIVVPADRAAEVWTALRHVDGLSPAGSLTYNALRIRAGRPAMGRELSPDYIPLEVGLWDEVSFRKGCYTGQEIIARMESRQKLAKVMVRLRLSAPINAPAEIAREGRTVGTLTSSVTSPDGEVFGIGVVKPALAQAGETLQVGTDVEAVVEGFAGTPPPIVTA
jgi:folate-binding protein YgfZ